MLGSFEAATTKVKGWLDYADLVALELASPLGPMELVHPSFGHTKVSLTIAGSMEEKKKKAHFGDLPDCNRRRRMSEQRSTGLKRE